MNRSKWKNLKSELFTNGLGVAALVILIVFTLGAIFAFLSGYDPNAMDAMARLTPPGAAHWFGTDDYGRDYLARALYGGRVSLLVGFASMIVATVIGVTVGVISGYFGGWLDNLLMRMLDVIMSIPSFLILLLLSVFLKPSVSNIIIIIALLMWMNVARVIRAEAMTIKEREYVLYAKASGQSATGIIWRHILPGLVPHYCRSNEQHCFGHYDGILAELSRLRRTAAACHLGQHAEQRAGLYCPGALLGVVSRADDFVNRTEL